jgi:hypothetical protein
MPWTQSLSGAWSRFIGSFRWTHFLTLTFRCWPSQETRFPDLPVLNWGFDRIAPGDVLAEPTANPRRGITSEHTALSCLSTWWKHCSALVDGPDAGVFVTEKHKEHGVHLHGMATISPETSRRAAAWAGTDWRFFKEDWFHYFGIARVTRIDRKEAVSAYVSKYVVKSGDFGLAFVGHNGILTELKGGTSE